jgi:hypothetical protein
LALSSAAMFGGGDPEEDMLMCVWEVLRFNGLFGLLMIEGYLKEGGDHTTPLCTPGKWDAGR